MLASLLLLAMTNAPAPCLPVPSPRQLAWHKMETYAFVHFSINTFTDREWGEGNEDPKLFAPTALDVEQWVRTFRDAGMKMVILTAKHHDGLCMWPSKHSEHTVMQSGAKVDILGLVSKACHKYGLKLGVYLSPWDRNHPTYGTPAYNDTFVAMLEEVFGNYGKVDEVWFDGANGEGPNGKKQVYDWPRFYATVRRLQPTACMFSDGGPDVRWVGNESGHSAETCWAMIPSNRYVPGTPHYQELTEGSETGDLWVPAECDVSIRPGWFYHASQDNQVKSVETLVDLYFQSVGQNGNFLLNVPPDRRGLIHENDVRALMGFRKYLDYTFKKDWARKATVSASTSRGAGFEASRAVDRNDATYWAAPDDQRSGTLTLTTPSITIDTLMLQEYIELGQRVKKFHVDARVDGGWRSIATGTTIGNKRLLRFPPVTATEFRVSIDDARACPTLRTVGLYASPRVLADQIQRRVDRDQAARAGVMAGQPTPEAIGAVQAVDQENLVYVKELIDRQGWLGESMLGAKGASNLWLLVQHMDRDPQFQERCLALMEKAVTAHEASAKDFAYLTDRVLRAQKKPQRYGTQLSNENGKWVVQPCEDPAHLDERRAGVGLMPMAEYLEYSITYFTKGEAAAEAVLRKIRPEADGTFTLTGEKAHLNGSLRYESDKKAVGFWTRPEDSIEWSIDVATRGEYDVDIELACPAEDAGSTMKLEVGGNTLSFTIPATASWSTFTKVRVGHVALVTPGITSVRLTASAILHGAVANIRAVTLKPRLVSLVP